MIFTSISTDGLLAKLRGRHYLATKIKFEVPPGNIEKIGLRVTRTSGAGKHGELGIWQNHLGFKPKGYETFYEVSWKDFTEWIVLSKTKGRKKAAKVISEI